MTEKFNKINTMYKNILFHYKILKFNKPIKLNSNSNASTNS